MHHTVHMPKPSIRSVVAPQIEIQYLEYGNPEGTPVFLLHGFPDSPATWSGVVDRLDTRRLRLIAPFVRGTGGTNVRQEEYMSGQIAALASDLFTLADVLGIESFHAIGHDWGARTAYAAAALAPRRVRGIVSLAVPYVSYRGKGESPSQAQAFWYQWYFNTEHGARTFAADPVSFSEFLWGAWSPRWRFGKKEFAEAAKAFANPQFVPLVLHSYRQRWKGAPGLPVYDSSEALLESKPSIEVPTVFAYGTADACDLPDSGEGQAGWFSGPYESVPVKGAGHFVQREEPKVVARLIERLLEKTGGAKS